MWAKYKQIKKKQTTQVTYEVAKMQKCCLKSPVKHCSVAWVCNIIIQLSNSYKIDCHKKKMLISLFRNLHLALLVKKFERMITFYWIIATQNVTKILACTILHQCKYSFKIVDISDKNMFKQFFKHCNTIKWLHMNIREYYLLKNIILHSEVCAI